ncbi:hypothetical protein QYE76_046721 [Lolium multiflorum]|uniref:Tf2-1-like SH3-like domain-containing protein n=1 Tax=Lolium multiflorum TaxID=4521 RepID=A0AAD8TQ14_LOLMU|nr:hypothetical protein QYE76_046721 [Lolium multiflorum]
MSSSDEKIVNHKNKDAANVMTWREYEALHNEMQREFHTQDEELKGTVQEVSQKQDATNETVNKMQDQMTDIQRSIQALTLAVDNLTLQQQQEDKDVELQDEAPGVGRGARCGNRGRGFVEPGARRAYPQQQDDGLGKPKFSIPKFEGGADDEEYLTWELKIEKLWCLHEYTEDRKVKLASSEFDGYALRWWDGVTRTRQEDNELPDHFKRDCPNRKVMIINEDNEYETGDDVDPYAPEDDDYDSDDVDAYPSEARTIVVSQRAVNVFPSASTQRSNLFQTKALVGPDKACKVIIDGGSCRNLASKELWTKLKLKYLPHSHPYYIQWLSDNGEMKVNHMVRVEFEIGRSTLARNPGVAPHYISPPSTFNVLLDSLASKRVDFVRKIHVKIKELIEKKVKNSAARVNKKRKEIFFKPGDMVWVHFRKDRFPKLRKSKLLHRGSGPYKVLAKINDNAYSIDFSIDEFGVSNSFNVDNLTPYDGEDLGAYEEGASIARGGEDQQDKKLDMELDMELDMKTSHGSARKEKEACARGEKEVQVGARPGRLATTPARLVPGPVQPGTRPAQPGANRIPSLCQPALSSMPGRLARSPPGARSGLTGLPGPGWGLCVLHWELYSESVLHEIETMIMPVLLCSYSIFWVKLEDHAY